MKRIWLAITTLVVFLAAVGCAGAAKSREEGQTVPSSLGASTVSEPAGGQSKSTNAAAWDRYVIRTADMTLVVKDVEAATEDVRRIVADAGGFVTQSNVRRDDQRVFGDVTVQVPSGSLETVMSNLKGLATLVENSRVTSQDVTEEYIDNDARLRNLQASEASIQKLLSSAQRMEDILSIQRELTRVRGEIETLQGRQNYLKRRVDMSTVVLHLRTEPSTQIALFRGAQQPWRTAGVAFQTSLAVFSVLFEILVAVVAFLWWVFPLALLIWALIRWRRGRRRTAAEQA